MLGFVCTIFISANNVCAEDKKVHLNIPQNMHALITYGHCKANTKIKDDKITVLNSIIKVEEGKVTNLSKQNKLLGEDYTIKETEAAEWKDQYMRCTEALVDARKVEWYEFNLKSVFTGSMVTLLLLLL